MTTLTQLRWRSPSVCFLDCFPGISHLWPTVQPPSISQLSVLSSRRQQHLVIKHPSPSSANMRFSSSLLGIHQFISVAQMLPITRAQTQALSAETPLNKTSPQSIISLQWSELQAGDASSSSAILKYEVGANVVTKGFSRALATYHFNGKCMEGEVWSSQRGRCVKIPRRSEPSKPEGRHHTKT